MSHTYTSLQYHLVLGTKERRPFLSKESFQDEFLSLLQRHGIAYEERYLWV